MPYNACGGDGLCRCCFCFSPVFSLVVARVAQRNCVCSAMADNIKLSSFDRGVEKMLKNELCA